MLVAYWLRAVVQFVVLTFQSEQKFLQIISKWESCTSYKLKWPYFTSAYRNPLFQNTPNFVRHICEQIKRSKKLFIDLEHGR